MISIPHLGTTDLARPFVSHSPIESRQPVESHGQVSVNPQGSVPVVAGGFRPMAPRAEPTPIVFTKRDAFHEKSQYSPGLRNGSEQWPEDDRDSAGLDSDSNGQDRAQEAINRLLDSILERFPIASPAILLFVGSENNAHTTATCARVAAGLADRKVGKILLVDSCPSKELTWANQAEDAIGLSNLLSHGTNWRDAVVNLPVGELDLLPAGTSHWEHWGAEKRLHQLSADLRREYQFICVTAGDAHRECSRLWSSVCDGSYLMVSVKNSNPSVAESAITELQTCGARILGCIATDAN